MQGRTPYIDGRIRDLGPIAGLTRDMSSGPNSDLIIQTHSFGNIELGDSASAPTVIDLTKWG